jgi:hypothetical protein
LYDYFLGGRDNYEVDRAAADRVIELIPEIRPTMNVRTHAGILPFFDGSDLLEPGLVQVPLWRPDGPLPDPEDLRRIGFYGGVGYKG